MNLYKLSAAAALVFSAGSARAQENALIIMLDDVGVDKISAYAGDYAGYAANADWLPDTQVIDSLANKGIRFTRAWGAPLCTPARASLQTGLYPHRHGQGTALGSNAAGFDPSTALMIGEFFTIRGYATGYFGKWHVGTEDALGGTGTPPLGDFTVEPHPSLSGWRRFYGLYDGYPGAGRSYTDWPRVGWLGATGQGRSADESAHMTDRTSAVAVSWINQQTDPWAAVVAFNAPHSADSASSSWQYGDEDPTRVYTASLAACLTNLPNPNCANEARAVYQAMMEHVDQEIGDLLNGITPAVLDETLIILIGDNGSPHVVQEDVFDVINRGKGSTYENGLRIPLIVADGGTWRTGAAGVITGWPRTAELAVGVQDVYQTLANQLEAVSVAGLDSESFTPCFTNTDIYCGWAERRYGYSEEFISSGAGISSAEIGVRFGHDKLVAEYDPIAGCLDATYYDTSTDPLETVPQVWPAWREDRLKDHFTDLHTPHLSSWAYDNGPLVGFCP